MTLFRTPYICGICEREGKPNAFSTRADFEDHVRGQGIDGHAPQPKTERDAHAQLLKDDGWDDTRGRWEMPPGRGVRR